MGSYCHVGRIEGQVPQGRQDSVLSAQEYDCSMDSHFSHCSFQAAVRRPGPQQGQTVIH